MCVCVLCLRVYKKKEDVGAVFVRGVEGPQREKTEDDRERERESMFWLLFSRT